MLLLSINNQLESNSYPGRGIIIGKTPNGKQAVTAYFIMGRSENSRNRVFIETADGIKTQAFDPAKLSDPSLVIYSPVREYKNNLIVTNGDQTDTVYDFLSEGKTFEQALRTREFEPDPPIFTPRISGILTFEEEFSYKLSILKSEGKGKACRRFFYEYNQPINGEGHFIHTYKCDGDPVPSFEGEPVGISISDDINQFADDIWNSLNSQNKVSLYVRYCDLDGKNPKTIIKNKHR